MTSVPYLETLNTEQREAVVSDHKRVLVLAGAGSGKTKTLLQKLAYLVEEKAVRPSNILAITFTKNACNEMTDRLLIAADPVGEYSRLITDKNRTSKEKDDLRYSQQKRTPWIDSLSIKTFHGFCYSVLRNHGVQEFDNKFRIIGDEKQAGDDLQRTAPETVFEVFQKLLIETCEDNSYLLNLKRYLLDYLIDKIHKTGDLKLLPKEGKYYTTLDGTKVRSKSEQYLADWLYRHSIRYEYEPLLNIKDFIFRPDFYVPDANMYIEHVTDKSYSMRNKEEQFKKGQILFVKTYEAMMNDSALINKTLEDILRSRLPHNYQLNRTLNFNEEFNGYYEEIKRFITDVMRVTDMIKVEGIRADEVLQTALEDQHDRVRGFYSLCIPLIKKYISYCVDRSYLDFNDLVSTTISLLKNHEDIRQLYQEKFQYILVDEFQDVNNLQVDLIKLLIKNETQLFCVGDDWQSIYGFRGSNVSYIVDFAKHFENSEVIKLNMNYRSTQNIVGASNEVIRHNKYKIEKKISSARISEHKILIFSGTNQNENCDFVVEQVKDLISSGHQGDDILFLYRRTKMYEPYLIRFKNEGIRVQAKTIHAAKGLEAKFVFIVGLTEGSGGFPDVWLEDRIYQVIKPSNHQLLMEEERRLFYVAITRAKDKLYLITEKGRESPFLKEIPSSFTVRSFHPIQALVEPLNLCKNCGSEVGKLWKLCAYCGQSLV